MDYHLCPSILSADFNRLGQQIQTLEEEGVKSVSYTHLTLPTN